MTTPAENASFAKNSYRGIENRAGGGFNVCMAGSGTMIMGIPQSWAAKAVALLNACTTREEQMVEVNRIRAALA